MNVNESLNHNPAAMRGSAGCNMAKAGFTLMEVMLACGILFMCLFGILALTTSSLRTARSLQQHKAVDVGTVAGLYYVKLANTNNVNPGEVDVDLSDIFPGYNTTGYVTPRETNGLCQVDFEVDRNNQLEFQSHFLIFITSLKEGMSQSLPQH